MLRNLMLYSGHILMGVSVGCLTGSILITLGAAVIGPTGNMLVTLAYWALGLIVVGVALGAVGIISYETPYDRKQRMARHALRRRLRP